MRLTKLDRQGAKFKLIEKPPNATLTGSTSKRSMEINVKIALPQSCINIQKTEAADHLHGYKYCCGNIKENPKVLA